MASTDQETALAAGRTGLTLVACPLIPAEVEAAVANLHRWNNEWTASPHEGPVRPGLAFIFNTAPDAALEAPLRQAWNRCDRVRQAFGGLEVRFLDLPPEKDLYVRNPTGPIPPYGFKSGPNWMFYGALKAGQEHGGFLFQMEVDCLPMVPTWLARLDRTCRRNDDAWVIGAHYSGASPLISHLARHINGNALYHVGDDEFMRFVENFFWPWMHRHIQEHDPNLAYDCAWESFIERAEMENTAHHDWHQARDVLHRFRLTSSIVNVAGYAEQKGLYAWTRAQLMKRFPQVAVVHGPVAETNAHRRGGLNVGRATLTELEVEKSAARFQSNDGRYSRSIWLQDADFRAGQQVIVRAQVADPAHRRLQVQLKDARGAVLENIRSVQATEAGREAKASFTLTEPHRFLVLHFRPIGAPDKPAGLIMSDVKVAVREGEKQVAHLPDLLR